MAKRTTDLRRRSPQREPRHRILVICEGRVTEPRYFHALRINFRNPLVEVEVDDRGGVPRTLVQRAVLRKKAAEREAKTNRDSFLRYDEVWCVFDVDEHPHLSDAREQARAHNIRLAVSNPCFELWALLHFQDQSSHLSRKSAQSRVRKHVPDYEKDLPFAQLKANYRVAVERAEALDRRCESAGNVGDNPSTSVYRLTERIRIGGRIAHQPR